MLTPVSALVLNGPWPLLTLEMSILHQAARSNFLLNYLRLLVALLEDFNLPDLSLSVMEIDRQSTRDFELVILST